MVTLADGTWQVGEAGSVTFHVEDGALRLDAVDPTTGWTPTVVAEEGDRVEVALRRGREQRALEARYDGATLRIGVEHDDDDADPGRFSVGSAGEVEVAVDGGELRLVEVATNPGWTMDIDTDRGRTVDVGFRRDEMLWDFEAELAASGRLAIETELALEGPYPGRR